MVSLGSLPVHLRAEAKRDLIGTILNRLARFMWLADQERMLEAEVAKADAHELICRYGFSFSLFYALAVIFAADIEIPDERVREYLGLAAA